MRKPRTGVCRGFGTLRAHQLSFSSLLCLVLLVLFQPLSAFSDDSATLPETNETPAASQKSLQEEGIFICSDYLRKGLQANGGGLSAFKYLLLRFRDPDTRNPLAWFEAQVSKGLQRVLRTRVAYHDLQKTGLKEGEQYYWIQQLHLKELNEHLLDIGGTQFYLQALDASLYTILEKDPALGRMIHVNYKDRVLVSPLNAKRFEESVIQPARNLTETYIRFLSKESGEKVDWKGFIDRSVRWNSGSSLAAAFLNLRLSLLGMEEGPWLAEIRGIRKKLLELAASEVSLRNVLRQFSRFKNESDLLYRALRLRFGAFVTEELLVDIKRYNELLSAADFLPIAKELNSDQRQLFEKLDQTVSSDVSSAIDQFAVMRSLFPEAWALHRAYFMNAAIGAKIIISTDIKGLGTHSLLDRDDWVRRGAVVEDLPHVYERTSQFLEERTGAFEAALRQIIGGDQRIIKYTSGDDGLWAIPELAAGKINELKDTLAALSQDFYFHIEVIPESSASENGENSEAQDPGDQIRSLTAHAIQNAWNSLFESKDGARLIERHNVLSELEALALEAELKAER